MTRCPITYKKLTSTKYSSKGLRMFSNRISALKDVEIDFNNGSSFSQNPQTKQCYARLQIKKESFIAGDKNDRYIFIRDNNSENQYIFNRDLTMKLAALSGLKTVVHGLAYHQNGGMVFWYKRPQFYGRYGLQQLDPLNELLPESSSSFFDNLKETLNSSCTFPAMEKLNLLRLALFSFLTGNDSIPLDNLSLIDNKGTTKIAPHFCLLNSHIYQNNNQSSSIIFLGKEIILTKTDDALSFATELLGVNPKAFKQVMNELNAIYLKWLKVIEISFVINPIKKDYFDLLRQRRKVFFKF